MGNNAWDRTIISPRERPLSSDVNAGWSQSDRTLREMLRAQFAGRSNGSTPFASSGSTPRSGFLADGFMVGPSSPAAMTVNVLAGYGFLDNLSDTAVDIGGALNLNDLSSYKPMFLGQTESLSVPAADPTNPRIDIVEVCYDRRTTDNSSRDVLDTGTGEFVATLVDKTLAWIQDGRSSINGSAKINYKSGTPDPSPVAPSVTSGYVKIAEVRVGAAVTTITQTNISDYRTLLAANGGQHEISGVITLVGTGTGAAAATMVSFNGPPGSAMASYPTLAAVGSNYTFHFWCGGAMKDLVLTLYGEHGGPVETFSAVVSDTLDSADLVFINGANGLVSGPAAAIGQVNATAIVRVYQKGTPGTLQSSDTNLHFSLKFRSY